MNTAEENMSPVGHVTGSFLSSIYSTEHLPHALILQVILFSTASHLDSSHIDLAQYFRLASYGHAAKHRITWPSEQYTCLGTQRMWDQTKVQVHTQWFRLPIQMAIICHWVLSLMTG